MSKFLKRFYVLVILLFLYAPILLLVVYSFNESKVMGNWTGFSLKWYAELFKDRDILLALRNTLLIALSATGISTVIGTAAAIGIHSLKKRGLRSAFLNISYLPILNPDIVTGVSMMVLFLALNFTLGFGTMLLAHVCFNVPYVLFAVLPKLRQMNPHAYEAALDLGATPGYAMRKVILPDIMPGVVTGALLAFTMSLDDFVISFFTTSSTQNLSILIYSMARRGIAPKINALSTLMFVVVLTLLLIVNRRDNNQDKKQTKLRKEGARV